MVMRAVGQSDIIGAREARSLPGLFYERVRRSPDAVAYSEYKDDRWRDFTWSAIGQRVAQLRGLLGQLKLAPGDRVAVLLANCTDWVCFDIAAMASGLITVPLYVHDSPESNAFLLENSGAVLCLVATMARWEEIARHLHEDPALRHVWLQEPDTEAAVASFHKAGVATLETLLRTAPAHSAAPQCDPRGVATIIYTSGTTGRPKGVMLTHAAILWNAEAVARLVPPFASDVLLSILPLAHAFERTLGYYVPMMGGSRVVYARSIEALREDLNSIRPTILVAVPRLYERFSAAIRRDAGKSALKTWLLSVTTRIGWQLHEWRHGRADDPGFFRRIFLWPLLKRVVGGKVLRAFGGRVRIAVSGGAALPEEASHLLIGLGLPLLEGYGLTEAAPVVTATTPQDNWPGSVGGPLHGLEVRLGKDGELEVRTPAIMKGYWQDPETTARAFSSDGWLKTGDLAEIREGHVFITGRLKDIIVLSTGENVAPNSIETAIQRDPLIEQICVVGDGRSCLVAIMVLHRDEWLKLADQLGIERSDMNSALAVEAIVSRIARQTRGLARPWQVRAVHALAEPWTVADGSLTPTLKIKRRIIEQRYSRQIDALYGELAARRHEQDG